MKKIYGNHLGIVISSADPENRGRVQVFIPHISNTLYKNWNDKLKDLVFKHIDSSVMDDDILNRLKSTLPWAECAAPIFGGASTAFYNPSTKKTAVEPIHKTLEEDGQTFTDQAGEARANQGSEAPAGNSQGNCDTNGEDFIPLGDNTDNSQVLSGNFTQTGNMTVWDDSRTASGISANSNTRIAFALPIRGENAVSGYTGGAAIADPIGGGSLNFGDLVQVTGPNGVSLIGPIIDVGPAQGLKSGAIIDGTPLANSLLGTDGLGAVTYRILSPSESASYRAANPNISTGDAGAQFASSLLTDESQTFADTYGSNVPAPDLSVPSSTETTTSSTADATTSEPVQNLNRSIGSKPTDHTVGGNGASVGYYSIPLEGSKVWVFFHGGDTQRPVYFASATEPEGWKNTLQSSSPPQKKVISSNTIKLIDAIKSRAGSLIMQTDIVNNGGSAPTDNSFISLQNSFGSLLKLIRGDIILNAQANLVENVETNKSSSVKGTVQSVVGQNDYKYIQGDAVTLIGKQTNKELSAAKELDYKVTEIQKKVIDSAKSGKTVSNPLNDVDYLQDNSESKIVNKLFDWFSNLSLISLPYMPFNSIILFMRMALTTTSNLSPTTAESILGRKAGDDVKVPDFEKANQTAKTEIQNNSDKIDELSKPLKGGTKVTLATGDIKLQAGLVINQAPAYVEVNGAKYTDPNKLSHGNTSTLVLDGKDTGKKLANIPPIPTVGNVEILAANKFMVIAGTPGIDFLTNGHTNIESGSTNITSTESETVVSSPTKTIIKGQHVNIEANDNSGKGGLTINSANTVTLGSFSATGDGAFKGGITCDGKLSAPYLEIPSMRGTTTAASGSNSTTLGATWFLNGASAITAQDTIQKLISRDSVPTNTFRIDHILNLVKEAYNTAMINISIEPVPIGWTASYPSGIQPVFGFTHTHALPSDTHTHDHKIPRGRYFKDRDAWGAARSEVSSVPTPAPAQGDDPNPGPNSNSSCGGAGFGFGDSNSSASKNRKKRNSSVGLADGDYDYSTITTGGQWTYDPTTGNLIPDPEFGLTDDC